MRAAAYDAGDLSHHGQRPDAVWLERAMPSLKEWESFYVIVGSSAAGLTGLQFVVMALVADLDMPTPARSVEAVATPTIVHFSVALLVSALLSAPWHTMSRVGFVLAALGAVGVVYSAIVLRRAREQPDYQPVFEDWAFHVLLPTVAYAVMAVSGYVLRRDSAPALFAIGAAVLLLLFIGIHNSWDTVTYLVLFRRNEKTPADAPRSESRDEAPIGRQG
jgi:hypothetical protein